MGADVGAVVEAREGDSESGAVGTAVCAAEGIPVGVMTGAALGNTPCAREGAADGVAVTGAAD